MLHTLFKNRGGVLNTWVGVGRDLLLQKAGPFSKPHHPGFLQSVVLYAQATHRSFLTDSGIIGFEKTDLV